MPKLAEVVETTRAVVVPQLAHRARALKMTLKARPAVQARAGALVGPAAGSAEVDPEWRRWSCT